MTSLNPLMTIGRQIGEAIALHQGLSPQRGDGQGGRDAAPRVDPRAGAPRPCLSAPAFGRHAPARDDRDGAVVQPQGADRRRADHRARRDDPGADPRTDARAAGDLRHRDHPDHPRHGRRRRERRPGGGDVCRPQGRGGRAPRRCSSSPGHPYTRGLLGSIPKLDVAARARCPPQPAERDQGHGAVASQSAGRLHLRAALRLRHRPVPRRLSAAGAASAGACDRLLARRALAGGARHDRHCQASTARSR